MPKQAKERLKVVGEFAMPGDVLGDVRGNTPSIGGEGTVRRGARLCATVAGKVVSGEGEAVSVQRKAKPTQTPFVGATILGKVKKVVGNFAHVDIFTVQGKLSYSTFKGIPTTVVVSIPSRLFIYWGNDCVAYSFPVRNSLVMQHYVEVWRTHYL